jgi:DNA-directed RNA polymerase specialized sigma24 family protein
MLQITKTPFDLIDNLYSLAYWMTGSDNTSRLLVRQTYKNAEFDAPETEVLKAFRECYLASYGQSVEFDLHEVIRKEGYSFADSVRQWSADIKLSVLLSEISGLKHGQISEIIGKPIETIRLWLFWGRKFLVSDNLLKASA